MTLNVFPLRPALPYLESLEFLTDVIEPHDGDEQRIKIRRSPRQTLEWRIVPETDLERSVLIAFLAGNQASEIIFPVWHEAAECSAGVAAAAVSVPVDPAYADYRAGSRAVIWERSDLYEAVDIDTVGADALALDEGVVNDYSPLAWVMPGRTGRIVDVIPLYDLEGSLQELDLTIRIMDNDLLTAFSLAVTYKTYGVLMTPTAFDGGRVERELVRPLDVMDYGAGVISVSSRMTWSRFNTTGARLILQSMQSIWEFRRWLHGIAGRLVPFWMPSFRRDLTVAAAFLADDTDISFQYIGYADYLVDHPGFSHLVFFRTGGAAIIREVTAAEVVGGLDVLTLDSALGFAGNDRHFEMVSFLTLYRLNSDRVELNWADRDIVESVLPLMGVNQ